MSLIQKENKTLTDTELLGEIANEQPEALSELYDRHASRLYGLAIKILKDPVLAEDVLQDLFFYIWRNAEAFDAKRGSAIAWLMIICRNRAIDKLRSKQKKNMRQSSIEDEKLPQLSTDESKTPFQDVHQKEVAQAVGKALQQLPDEQKVVIEMAYFQGLSQSEMSEALNVPLGTIKTRVRLGMQKLRGLIK